MNIEIHPTAMVDKNAQLGEGVKVGPYATIGADVKVGEGTTIGQGAILDGHTTIGANCQIFPYALIGMKMAKEKMFYGMVFITVIALSFVIETPSRTICTLSSSPASTTMEAFVADPLIT